MATILRPFARLNCMLCLSLVVAAGCAEPGGGETGAADAQSPVATIGDEVDTNAADAAQPTTSEAPPSLLTDAELAEGWIALFDGQTLFGWQPATEANWRVADGAIVVDGGEPGLLCTTTQFTDYVLKVDFRCPTTTNSGVFLHTPPKPEAPARDCYELNIAGSDNPFPTGSLVHRAKAEGEFQRDGWQSYEVTLTGGDVTVKLDGETILTYSDPKPLRRGFIGLQLNQGLVEFRNIKLRPVGLESLFNGKDLAGWKTYPDQPSVFSVTEEGWLNVKNGRGQLETEQSFGDFVLQLECIAYAPELNSGIFFRCIPGDVMNGYESQIHNGFKDGDRTQPVDCGTGGIFRRVNARRVVADDGRWFHKTLIADGPHMSVWVNGYQVTDWTDERTPDENPRNGLRLDPGTIMIQGHDPTTDLSFRNLRILELAKQR